MMRKVLAALLALLIALPVFAADITNPPGAEGGPNAQTTAGGTFNLNATSLPFFRKAVANAKAGISRGKIAIIVDSTGMGAGTGTSGTSNLNGAAQRAWPQLLGSFAGGPIGISSNTWWGTQGFDSAAGITLPGYDTRLLTPGANWSPNLTSLGGKVIRYATGAVNNWVYTPTYAFDSFTVYFLKNSGNGSMTANVDGGASLGTITTTNASLVWATQTFTGITKGIHTINLVPNNDGQIFIVGIVPWDSTVPALDVVQTAVYGATAATFTPNVNVYDAIPTLKFLAPAVTVIGLTINDSNAQTALATYSANLQIITTAAKVSGDCMYLVGPPSNTAQATNGVLDQYIAIIYTLAVLNNCPVINLKTRWVSYAVTNPILPYFDTLHPGVLGNQDESQAVYGALMRVLSGSFLLKRDLDPASNDNDPVWLEKAA